MFFQLIPFLIQVSIAQASWTSVDQLLDAKAKATGRLYPGAALLVGDKATDLHTKFAGKYGSDTLFDLASLTKVFATTTSVMILEEQGKLSLSDNLSKYFPEFQGGSKDSVTLQDVMRHQSGLSDWAEPQSGEALDTYLSRITSASLAYPPRTKTLYSDLSFIVMGKIVELVSGQTLDAFAEENIFKPLNLTSTTFHVALEQLGRCAPTLSSRVPCTPHDPIAIAFYPISIGNAGLFTTITDLSRFARMMLRGGELDGVRILKPETVQKMTTIQPGQIRGLGWDLMSGLSNAPRGDIYPAGISYGHTGYTGTTIWIDPKSETFYVFLSNRVYTGDSPAFIKKFALFRRQLATLIGKTVYSSLPQPALETSDQSELQSQ